MVSITMSISEDFKNELKSVSWINWSEIAREESKKKLIFEKYLKTKKVTNKDWIFCEKIDWHPVDELPLRESFIKEIRKISENTTNSIKYDSVEELFNDLHSGSKVQKKSRQTRKKQPRIKKKTR